MLINNGNNRKYKKQEIMELTELMELMEITEVTEIIEKDKKHLMLIKNGEETVLFTLTKISLSKIPISSN